MDKIKIIEGDLVLHEVTRFGILVSRFNDFIVNQLLSGCLNILQRHGVKPEDIAVVKVPGAREMLLLAKHMGASGKFDAIIALGAIIRGETPHFDYVASACSLGLAAISTEFDVPVAFGVLTVDTIEQAIERAGTKAGNKGAEAAMAAIEMVSLIRKLSA